MRNHNIRPAHRIALVLLALAAVAQPVSAQEGTGRPAQEAAAGKSEAAVCMSCGLSGDWGGYRSRLQDLGITFVGNVTQFGFGVGGGISAPAPPPLTQGDRFSYTGRGDYGLRFDLEKFGGLPKGTLVVGVEHWYGEFGNVSAATGAEAPAVFAARLPPTPNDPGIPFLTNFYLLQPLAENLIVFAGKKALVGEEEQTRFAGGNGTQQFVHQALVADPSFLRSLPYTSFVVGAISPQKWGQIAVSARDPLERTKDTLGLDDLYSDGVILIGEVRFTTGFFDLPGEQYVGAVWKRFPQQNLRAFLSPPEQFPVPASSAPQALPLPTLAEGYTAFYGFDQYVVRYSDEPGRGWGFFGRASFSDRNTPLQYFLSGGIGGDSPLKGRQGDAFGLGVYYAGTSDEFSPTARTLFGIRNGKGVEVFYKIQITPWLHVTPDFQYIRGGFSRLADEAFVFGWRVNISL